MTSFLRLGQNSWVFPKEKILRIHRMARDNLKKSKYFSTSTTTASKYIPKRPRICINWNPPFQTQIYLVNVPLNVNIVKQDLHNKNLFLNFTNWGLKGGISIDTDSGPLGYVLWCCSSRSWEVSPFFSDWLWPYCGIAIRIEETIFEIRPYCLKFNQLSGIP